MKSAYLVIAHGSKNQESNEAFVEFLVKLKKASPDRMIEGAYLEIESPSVPQGIEACLRHDVDEIFVIPLMFFPGKHVRDHIPGFIQEAHEKYPQVTFHYSGPLCEDPALLDIIKTKVTS